jgi:hypothetical protein
MQNRILRKTEYYAKRNAIKLYKLEYYAKRDTAEHRILCKIEKHIKSL